MSVAGFSFPHRLRTVSAQLRSAAGIEDPTTNYPQNDLYSPHGNEWNSIGYPEQQPTNYQEGYSHFMPENDFNDYGSISSQPQGLGFDMSMQMNGIEEESQEYESLPVKQEEGVENGSESLDSGHQTRHQTRTSRNQVFPTQSSFSSSNRSRTSSLASQHSGSLQLSALSSPNSPFFPGPLPSPFRNQPATFNSEASATINPSASVRGSSPSDASSSSNLTHSRAESTGSSPPESLASSSNAPRRNDSISGRASARSNTLKHTRRNSAAASPTKNYSPTKGNRSNRRLTNAQRREICIFQRTHPTMKQDDIGRVFNYERSTISKTLKDKEHWLSDNWEDPEPSNRKRLSHRAKSRSVSSLPVSDNEYDSIAERTPNLASVTPQPSPALPSYSAPAPASPPPPVFKGRFPAIDKALTEWAHQQVPLGTVLTDNVLQSQAKLIASKMPGYESFKASHTWLEGFKTRVGIRDGTFRNSEARTMSRSASRQSMTLDDIAGSSIAPAEEEEEEEASIRRSTRQKRSTFASKSLHRLTNSQSSLSFDSPRISSPAPHSNSSDLHAGNFGDISMDSESTPTHSTVHSRAATSGHGQASGLADPYSYSPTNRIGGGHSAHGTPSRLVIGGAPSSLVLDEHSPVELLAPQYHDQQQAQYPYSNDLNQSSFAPFDLSAFQPPPFGSLSTSSSQSSLANFDLGTSTSSLAPPGDFTASPVPSFHHHRSGSTASSTSIYSGLTAFSSTNGTGTPLTGSAYGSFRTSPGDACSSMPSTPAHGSYFEPSQMSSFVPSPLQQQPIFSQVSQLDSTHQRYPSQQSLDGTSSASSISPARRATISGGAPFQGRTSIPASATPTVVPSPPPIQGPVSLDEAYASLKVALSFLGVNEGFARPADFVTFSDIMAKMEDRRVPAVNSAPSSTLNSPYQPSHAQLQQQNTLPSVPSRLKLTRTQSASNVPTFGGNGWPSNTHRSKNSVSLLEVDGH